MLGGRGAGGGGRGAGGGGRGAGGEGRSGFSTSTWSSSSKILEKINFQLILCVNHLY